MSILLIFGGMVWGAASAQFLLQTLTSLLAAFFFLAGVILSKCDRRDNALGCFVMVVQAVVFGLLFVAGNWFVSSYIDYGNPNIPSVASLIVFLVTLFYVGRDMPGRLLLARLTAFNPMFAMAVNKWPRDQRVALAKRYRETPTAQTLTEIYRQPTTHGTKAGCI